MNLAEPQLYMPDDILMYLSLLWNEFCGICLLYIQASLRLTTCSTVFSLGGSNIWPVRRGPEEGHKHDHRTGTLLLQRQSEGYGVAWPLQGDLIVAFLYLKWAYRKAGEGPGCFLHFCFDISCCPNSQVYESVIMECTYYIQCANKVMKRMNYRELLFVPPPPSYLLHLHGKLSYFRPIYLPKNNILIFFFPRK